MSQDASAGRLVVDVVSDTSGFARDLQRKVGEAVRAVKAEIKVTADTSAAEAAIARVAEKRRVAEIRVQADTASARVELDRLAQTRTAQIKVEADSAAARIELDRIASAQRVAKIRVQVDLSDADVARLNALTGVRRDIQLRAVLDRDSLAWVEIQINRFLRRPFIATIQARADTAAARAEIDELSRDRDMTINVHTNNPNPIPSPGGGGGFGGGESSLMSVSAVAAITGGIGVLVSTVAALAEGLVAVAGAASQALGVLGAIPAALAGVGQIVGSVVLGFGGIGEAVKASSQAETQAATASGASARQRVMAARRIADAQRAVADAQEQAARRVRDAQEQVAQASQAAAERVQSAMQAAASAEQDLARAQEQTKRAQLELNQAREDAVQKIKDMALALKGAALDEESAQIQVERARRRLEETNASATATGLDRREADLAYRQAIQNLEEVKNRNKELQDQYNKTAKAGVDGVKEVVDARDRLVQAQQNEADARQRAAQAEAEVRKAQVQGAQEVARAQRQAAEAQADAAKSVANAQRNLAEAQQDARLGAEGSSAAFTKQAQAMAQLSPAGQRFVKFIRGTLQPAFINLRKNVQTAILPGIQEGATRALPLLKTIQDGLSGTGKILGDLAVQAGTLAGSSFFRGQIATIMSSNNRAITSLGQAAFYALQAIVTLSTKAGPTLERFTKWIELLAVRVDGFVTVHAGNGDLTHWFQIAADRAAQLGRIVSNLAKTLWGIFKAGVPAGNSLLASIENVTKAWARFVNSESGQARLQAGFERVVPTVQAVGQALSNVVAFLARLGTYGDGLTSFWRTLGNIFGALNRLLNIPGMGEFINGLFLITGTVGAFGFLGAAILKVVGPTLALIRWLGDLDLHFLALYGRVYRAALAIKAWTLAMAAALRTGYLGQLVAQLKQFIILSYQAIAANGWSGVLHSLGLAWVGLYGNVLRVTDAIKTWTLAQIAAVQAANATTIAIKALEVAAIAGAAAIAAMGAQWVGKHLADMQSFQADTVELTKSLVDLGRTGKLTGDALKLLGGEGSKSLSDFSDTLKFVAGDSMWQKFNRFWDAGSGGQDLERWKTQIAQVDQSLANLVKGGKAEDAGKAFSQLQLAAKDAGVPMSKLVELFPQYQDALKETGGVMDDAKGHFGTLASEEKRVSDETDTMRDALDKVLGKFQSIPEAVSDYQQAIADLSGAIKDNTEKVITNRGTIDLSREAGRRLQARIIGMIQQTKDYSTAVLQQTDDSGKANAVWNEGRERLIKLLTQMTGNRKEAIRLADSYGAIPDLVSTKFNTPGMDAARRSVQGLKADINAVNGKTVTVKVNAEGAIYQSVKVNKDGSVYYGPRVVAKAEGGRLPGRPSRTDNMLVHAASGEYVVNAEQTSRNLPLLEAINAGQGKLAQYVAQAGIPAFARGGLVDRVIGREVAVRGATEIPKFAPFYNKVLANTTNLLAARTASLYAKINSAVSSLSGGTFGRGGHWPGIIPGHVAANTAAAVQYVRHMWHLNNIGTLGSRPNKSDHPLGKAMDVMIPGWTRGSGISLGNQIAQWFVAHPGNFGTKYVIWRAKIDTGSGWRPYRHPNGSTDPTSMHMDHVHVSFLKNGGVIPAQPGGTLAMLGEAGRNEAVVDEGLLNARLARDDKVAKKLDQVIAALERMGGPSGDIIVQGAQMNTQELARAISVEMGWQRR